MTVTDDRLGLGRPTDVELMARIRHGDDTAFAVLFDRHAQTVWNYAYRLTASWSEAEDIAAVAYLTFWRRRRDVRVVNGSALPWLLKVTSTVNRNERRRLARFLRAVPRLATAEAGPDHADELTDQAGNRARLARVLSAVHQLPRAERQAIELCALGRMSTADAAELLGISETGVRSRLSRARLRLHHLTDEERDD